jgi:hypothetical protein
MQRPSLDHDVGAVAPDLRGGLAVVPARRAPGLRRQLAAAAPRVRRVWCARSYRVHSVPGTMYTMMRYVVHYVPGTWHLVHYDEVPGTLCTWHLGYRRYTSYELIWGEARHWYIPILLAPLAKANDRIRDIREYSICPSRTVYRVYHTR